MAKQKSEFTGPFYPKTESGQLLAPPDVGGRAENFVRTHEGTLRSLAGFLPYQPNRTDLAGDPQQHFTAGYGRMRGIFHTVLADNNDMLLMHMEDAIYEHVGSLKCWRLLIGTESSETPSGDQAIYLLDDLANDDRAQWPTQFVATPSGVIILPTLGLPFFYDGHIAAPLGFVDTPGSPVGQGPRNATTTTAILAGNGSGNSDDNDNDNPSAGVNVLGYAHDVNPAYHWGGDLLIYPDAAALAANGNDYQTGMWPGFGRSRVGTVATDQSAMDTSNTGRIEMSSYNAAVQWVDPWGNLSALSGRSASVPIYPQSGRENKSKRRDSANVLTDYFEYNPDALLKQLLWTGLDTGPRHCVGRVLLRTKDTLHSGTNALFEVPSGAGAFQQFATIPDNLTTLYPDNVPDGWLVAEAQRTRAMPRARLGALAFGMAFYANSPDEPGTIWWSYPGQWGTIGENSWLIPDSSAREITGLHASAAGLFIFTLTSTFLIKPGDDGRGGFVPAPLSATLGCVAPSSIQTLADGTVIWMSRDGFCSYTPSASFFERATVVRIGHEIDYYFEQVNKARWEQSVSAVDPESGEYRCWAPSIESIYNDMAFVYTPGEGFRRWRAPMQPADVCVTRDHRRYMLAAGRANPTVMTAPIADTDGGWESGVWLIDHATYGYDIEAAAVFETNWVGNETSFGRQSGHSVKLWLRSTQKTGTLTVEVMRDWREEVIETHTVPLYPTDIDDIPEFGDVTYTDGEAWLRRRPFWAACDFAAPGAEVFKLRFKVTASPVSWEFLGMMFRSSLKGAAAVRNAQ